MPISVTESSGNTISVAVSGGTSTTFNTTSTSVSVTPSPRRTIDVKAQGPKGDQGIQGVQGVQGAQGDAGPAGAGLVVGGSENQFIQKNSATDHDTKWSAYTLPSADGDDGQVLTTNGAGVVTFTSLSASDVVDDLTPQLGGNLDVQSFNLFTSATNGDIQFTPNGTGSINLDGTLKFKRFTSAPTAFEGGMYADNNDDLYFGVS
jgi:hypothetical protein